MASSSSTGASGAAAHSDAAALIAPFISAVLNASSRGAGGASASAAAAAAAAGEGAVQNILVGVLDTIMARLNTRMDQHDAGLRQLSERIVSLEREIKERLPHVSDRPLSDALLRKGLRAVWGNETFVTPIVTLESVDYINKVLVAAGGAPFDPVAARSNPVVNNALMDVAKRLGEIAKLEFSELVQRVRNSISSELEKVLTSSNVRRPPSRGIYPDIESLANNVAERCLSGGSLAKLRPTFKRELHLLRKLVATAREEGGVRIRKALANEVLAITQRSADDQERAWHQIEQESLAIPFPRLSEQAEARAMGSVVAGGGRSSSSSDVAPSGELVRQAVVLGDASDDDAAKMGKRRIAPVRVLAPVAKRSKLDNPN